MFAVRNLLRSARSAQSPDLAGFVVRTTNSLLLLFRGSVALPLGGDDADSAIPFHIGALNPLKILHSLLAQGGKEFFFADELLGQIAPDHLAVFNQQSRRRMDQALDTRESVAHPVEGIGPKDNRGD